MSVVAVPGPSAITAALSIAGLPTERFSFEGFLAGAARRAAHARSRSSRPRRARWCSSKRRIALPNRSRTWRAAFGATRRAAVARELTKVFETVYRGTLAELAAQARSDANFTRGEITVVVEGAPRAPRTTAPRAQLDATLTRAADRACAEQGRGAGRAAHGREAQRRLRARARARRKARDDQPLTARTRRANALVNAWRHAAMVRAESAGRSLHFSRNGEESPGSCGQGAR